MLLVHDPGAADVRNYVHRALVTAAVSQTPAGGWNLISTVASMLLLVMHADTVITLCAYGMCSKGTCQENFTTTRGCLILGTARVKALDCLKKEERKKEERK